MSESKLHPAITVNQIKNLIPITLEMEKSRYASWAELFKITCRAYDLIDHITPPAKPTPSSSKDKESYDGVDVHLQQSNPLPPFYEARSRLILEETRKSKQAANSAIKDGAALISTTASTPKQTQTGGFNNVKPTTGNAPSSNNRGGRGGHNNRGGMNNGGRGRGRTNGAWTRPTYPNGSQGILGPHPQHAYAASVVPTASYAPTDIETAMHTMTLNPPGENWYVDKGATSHMTASLGKLRSYFNLSNSKHIIVGNGYKIPIHGYGHTTLRHSSRSLFLKNDLHAPTLIKNLVSVSRLSVDNNISLDFDPFGFTVKDYPTGTPIMRCNSTGDLYPINTSVLQQLRQPSMFVAFSQDLWHYHLGHPSVSVLRSLRNKNYIQCNRSRSSSLCQSCVFGKHVKLSFYDSCSFTLSPFDIILSDLWTSPVLSTAGHSYYVLFLDDLSNFIWTFPLGQKSQDIHHLSRSGPTIDQPVNTTVDQPQISPNDAFQPSSSGPSSSGPSALCSLLQASFINSRVIPSRSPPVSRPHVSTPTHTPARSMTSRSMSGITKTKTPFNMSVSVTPSPIPTNPKTALSNPDWKQAMTDEYITLIANKTWVLVPRTSDMHAIRSIWIFKHKLNSEGSFERYKARLVGDGRSQHVGIDCEDTFSPVVKPATIRTVLNLALFKSWPIHQLDVKNAFFMKSLYGLKQAPGAWYQRFAEFVSTIGFVHIKCDHSLFIYRHGRDVAYLLLYLEDIILTTSTTSLRKSLMARLSHEFAMKDLGPLSYFLGVTVSRTHHGMFLSQTKHAKEIIERAGMSSCKPAHTPIDTSPKLSTSSGDAFPDPTYYRSLAGALQYLTFTRPDISYAVRQICHHMHDPHDGHMQALKSIIRYLQGTLSYCLHLSKTANHSLVAYTDADWVLHVPSRYQLADIFTKGLPRVLFDDFRDSLSIRPPTASTAGDY
nr:hypothetical protein [Tanacetum cinerariifolium]